MRRTRLGPSILVSLLCLSLPALAQGADGAASDGAASNGAASNGAASDEGAGRARSGNATRGGFGTENGYESGLYGGRSSLAVPVGVVEEALAGPGDGRDTGALIGTAEPLFLGEVLDAVRDTHPDLEAARRKVDSAFGKRRAAEGVWDPKIKASGKANPIGFYQYGELDAAVRQETPLWGLGLEAGYRASIGDLPDYYGERETTPAGELRFGLDVPLLKDGFTDEKRTKVTQTRYLADASVCKRRAVELKIQRKAAGVYWKWVATGQQVRIQRELLKVALYRDSAIRDRVEEGSAPPILIIDNERLVFDREGALVEAERALREQTLELSLFLRDAALDPIVVAPERVPASMPPLGKGPLHERTFELDEALERRPELCALAAERAAAQAGVVLADNQRAPDVRAMAYLAKDMGLGKASLEPTEAGVGLKVEMPATLREARGTYRAASASLREIEARLRGTRDMIRAEVQLARANLEAAREQVGLAERQFQAAVRLAEAERAKLEEGASDLVILNLREQSQARAESKRVKAVADFHRAEAEYITALGLGL